MEKGEGKKENLNIICLYLSVYLLGKLGSSLNFCVINFSVGFF